MTTTDYWDDIECLLGNPHLTVYCYRRNNVITISLNSGGAITNTAEQVLAVLPEKYRPIAQQDFQAGTGGRIFVQSNGNILLGVPHTSASGISFSCTYLALNNIT